MTNQSPALFSEAKKTHISISSTAFLSVFLLLTALPAGGAFCEFSHRSHERLDFDPGRPGHLAVQFCHQRPTGPDHWARPHRGHHRRCWCGAPAPMPVARH